MIIPREIVSKALNHNAAAIIWRTTIRPEMPRRQMQILK